MKTVDVKFENLEIAAKIVAREINAHFKQKNSWTLDYNFYVQEVFRTAFGHNLDDYLKEALNGKYVFDFETHNFKSIRDGRFVIKKSSKTKKKKR